MIKKLMGVLPAVVLVAVPLSGPAAAAPADLTPAAGRVAVTQPLAAPPAASDVPLFQALAWLEEASEGPRAGYSREQFKHWNKGLNPTDGCDTRKEVILSEALERPAIGAKCALTGGRWFSEYDQVWVTSASALDVDHMVPLAEAWDSGAASWTAARREAYANDQGATDSLIAVSGSSNRSKADKDPADWLPVPADHCKYGGDWIKDKLRWGLTADPAEISALTNLAEGCPETRISYEQAA
ncbi:HNH endonuclease family protein [Streptomyces sp. NPDC051079]|uniref:HNH endonuclease family protein n=1 Tax=Streptomyces sp. NPDC051079 TaxID=3155043 RepID=UPI00344C5581